MDRMNATELAANQFRMTQAREKLQKQNIKGQEQAIVTHNKVGKEVRDAIKRIGGTLPENILPAEHIRIVQKRIKGVAQKQTEFVSGLGRKQQSPNKLPVGHTGQ